MKYILLSIICFYSINVNSQTLLLIDKKASKKTVNLYNNLERLSQKGILFGHQDDPSYGVGWWAEPGKSDVKLMTGSYPGVFGWDLGEIGNDRNLDSVSFNDMKKWIVETYKRGGINTISWHMENLSIDGTSWDKDATVVHILPGGKDHQAYIAKLDLFSDFVNDLKAGFTKVPILFRPFHEHSGDWFWWGKGNCTEKEYIQLWQFTVTYLRDTKKLHNLIYIFSPDASRLDSNDLENSYLYGYPGDDYVDILGIDDYWNVDRKDNSKSIADQMVQYKTNLVMVTKLAASKNKFATLSETGQNGITNPTWYSTYLVEPIISNDSIKIAYAHVWRNYNTGHHYAPYVGHPAEEDFKSFRNNKNIYFEDDVQNMYKSNKGLIKANQ